ncbi:hypothetical protein NVP1208B_34 [Vibrio phage 1.208.B._10N.222.52.A7]|nr:hypothetical protein NVP1208B_34 [Vibrio phage 1.208.B._10N.222.52.A7]
MSISKSKIQKLVVVKRDLTRLEATKAALGVNKSYNRDKDIHLISEALIAAINERKELYWKLCEEVYNA